MAGIPSKIEPTMKGKKLPLIQKIKYHELNSFLNREKILLEENYLQMKTQEIYMQQKKAMQKLIG